MSIDLLLLTKIFATLFIIILVPNYWKNNGPGNFLWLSDIGLFMTVLALWLQSPLLMSMSAVGILLPEIAWNVDYFLQLFTGKNFFGISSYMFDPKEPISSRRLSLFHVVMPVIWIIALFKWGYDERAFHYQVILTWLAFLLTYFLTNPKKNINWVFLPQVYHWKIPVWVWLIVGSLAYTVVIIWTTHLFLKRFAVI